jgi:hypothetical protein
MNDLIILGVSADEIKEPRTTISDYVMCLAADGEPADLDRVSGLRRVDWSCNRFWVRKEIDKRGLIAAILRS